MPVPYVSTRNPQAAAQNQRDMIQQRGDTLGATADRQQQEELSRRRMTGGYLDQLFDPMATGRGGYSADEAAGIKGDPFAGARTVDDYASKIEMSPEEKQGIVTGAGITAGNRYRSAVDATERSAKAAGMNPMGVAAHRQRMEREGAGEAADAMTQARVRAGDASAGRATTVMGAKVGAQNYGDVASSNRTQTIADTRLGQQTQGLNYYQGQNAQANQNQNAAADRAVGVYGTQTQGTNQAAGLTQQASQNPSTFQKVMGGVGGALSAASFLEDGGIVSEPTVAILGENGPEAVVPLTPRPEAKVRPGVASYGQSQMPTQRPMPQRRFYGQPAA
jgi:hypothetical protein